MAATQHQLSATAACAYLICLQVYYESIVSGHNDGNAYAKVFEWYDRDGDGVIDMAEFRSMLADLGMLEGRCVHFCIDYAVSQMDGER